MKHHSKLSFLIFFSTTMTLAALISILILLISFSIKTATLTQAHCLPHQRDSLIHLKQGFNTTELHSWNTSTDCCIWDSIRCDEQTGMVTALNLFYMWISGELNPALFNLSSLRYLNLSYNNFVSLPQTGFERLANLTHLDLSYSGFVGPIPIGIFALTNLISIDLSNDFTMYLYETGLKSLLSNLSKFQVLRLDGVNISLNGNEWDKSVFQVSSNLKELSMAYCGLSGNFPEEIFQLTNLTYLDLSNNPMLSGQLPEFTKQSVLQYLSLENTNFTGPLPDSNGNLQYLSQLYLSDCNFYGKIPSTIANLTGLKDLELSSNRLTGRIPSEFARLQKLESLDLSSNQLSGLIPQELTSLTYLETIKLSCNNLIGEIPSEFALLQKLESLDLSSNQLSGPIPQELTSLPYLETLNLSCNNLIGEIPESNKFPSFSNDSYLGNPRLCGSPLSMQCVTTPSNNGFNEGLPSDYSTSTDIIGFSVSIGVGLYLGFTSVIWALVFWENGRKWFILVTDKFYFQYFAVMEISI